MSRFYMPLSLLFFFFCLVLSLRVENKKKRDDRVLLNVGQTSVKRRRMTTSMREVEQLYR